MSNIISKILSAVVVVIALFVVASVSGAEAKASEGLMHSFKAKRDVVTGETVTRVDNYVPGGFSGLICATEVLGSRRGHLGCLRVSPNLSRLYSGEPGAVQFGVMTKFGGSVRYTYQEFEGGPWRAVGPTDRL